QRQNELDPVSKRSSQHQVQSAEGNLVVLERGNLDRTIPRFAGIIVERPGSQHGHPEGTGLYQDLLEHEAGRSAGANRPRRFLLEVVGVERNEVGVLAQSPRGCIGARSSRRLKLIFGRAPAPGEKGRRRQEQSSDGQSWLGRSPYWARKPLARYLGYRGRRE